jgi:hypothetical protein
VALARSGVDDRALSAYWHGESSSNLEVSAVHVLHRPQPQRVIAVTVMAALLSIVLTLAFARAAGDRIGPTASVTALSGAPALQRSATRPGFGTSPFARSPFSPLVTAPVATPWTDNAR